MGYKETQKMATQLLIAIGSDRNVLNSIFDSKYDYFAPDCFLEEEWTKTWLRTWADISICLAEVFGDPHGKN